MYKMYGCIKMGFIIITVFFLTNCSNNLTDTNENNENSWELEGSWVGSHFEFISQADSTQKADLSTYVQFSMVITADSSYSSTITFLGTPTSEAGKITINGNQITLTTTMYDSKSGEYEITDSGVSIVIYEEEFDFNRDGINEPADLYIDLVRANY